MRVRSISGSFEGGCGEGGRDGWPRGGRSEMTRKAIFSEGRGLRVRVVRPHECRGIPFSPDNEARGPWPTGHMPRSGPCALRGRAEPAPPRGGPSRARWPWGGKPWDNAKGVFLGGTHSVRPRGMARILRWQNFSWSCGATTGIGREAKAYACAV